MFEEILEFFQLFKKNSKLFQFLENYIHFLKKFRNDFNFLKQLKIIS